jgi:NADH-quinone oxidoreductase subunit N
MRHELLLAVAAVFILCVEIFINPARKNSISLIAIVLFSVVTIAGFFPAHGTGTLFGGMYVASRISALMKNILNIGVLLVMIQSVTWLKKAENADRISEYFILIMSTLIGMDFMISAGHFLIFYIGLELATIPVADRKSVV